MSEGSSSLAKTMDARRRELGLRWKDVANEAAISEETLRIVRKDGRAKAVRTTNTELKIERALRWTKGSISAIRKGDQPTPLPGTPGTPGSKEPFPLPGALLWPSRTPRPGRTYPEFVGTDIGYRAIWDIPDELLSEPERRYAIAQIELLRWMKHA